MDIFQLLRQDHTEAMGLLMEWTCRPDGPGGVEAWARWTEKYEVHVRIEENFLYPLLKGDPDLRRSLAQAVEAHAEIRKSIQDMPHFDEHSQAWVRRVADLVESVEGLVDLEELRLFPLARSVLSRDDAEDLALEVMDFLQGLRSALAAGH